MTNHRDAGFRGRLPLATSMALALAAFGCFDAKDDSHKQLDAGKTVDRGAGDIGGDIANLADKGLTCPHRMHLYDTSLVNGKAVDPKNPVVSLGAGAAIKGKLIIKHTNSVSSSSMVPVIWTPSWGDHATSFKTITTWVGAGEKNIEVPLDLKAPQNAGTHYILVASAAQTAGKWVASVTAWTAGTAKWNDGNDVAGWNMDIIGDISRGCVDINELDKDGKYNRTAYGAAYLKLVVK